MKPLVLVTGGRDVVCADAIFRPAVRPLPGREARKAGEEVVTSSIVATAPRRWRKPRQCLVRTPAGEHRVSVHPHPDGTIRIEGPTTDAIARELRLK